MLCHAGGCHAGSPGDLWSFHVSMLGGTAARAVGRGGEPNLVKETGYVGWPKVLAMKLPNK